MRKLLSLILAVTMLLFAFNAFAEGQEGTPPGDPPSGDMGTPPGDPPSGEMGTPPDGEGFASFNGRKRKQPPQGYPAGVS